MQTIRRLESEVRSYCRSFPTVFEKAQGEFLTDKDGRRYIDFLAGAGTLNYGHNPPRLKRKLMEYIERDGVVHGLDMATHAKQLFLERFDEIILKPRKLSYKVQFPGPTGTNAVEAALKLARKVTGRKNVVYFANGFHGMTLGSLAVTSNPKKRAGAGVTLNDAVRMPYDLDREDSLDVLRDYLEENSGDARPAAVIVETVQGEGGARAASFGWLSGLAELLRKHEVLLIVDDIQMGCGRVGPFFSFEPAGIRPDIVCLSKSISGFGLPMALVLLKPELDVWNPGEHNGTFRGHNLAFITAAESLLDWRSEKMQMQTQTKAALINDRLAALVDRYAGVGAELRGRGMIQGIAFEDSETAGEISRQAFERGLVIETSGPQDEVIKLLPPLTIETQNLETGLDILAESFDAVLSSDEDEEPARHVA